MEPPINNSQGVTKPWARVLILILSICAILWMSYATTGAFLPDSPGQALIFQNAILLIVLGSALIEHKFTKPADSVVNSLMGMITLFTVYGRTGTLSWWLLWTYCAIVFLLSTVCTAVSSGKDISGWRNKVSNITYRPSVILGSARILFSMLFLFGIFSFYGTSSKETAMLVVFWGIFVVMWPLKVPELISSLTISRKKQTPIGKIIRTDWPNLVRVSIDSTTDWSRNKLKVFQQPDGVQKRVLPLYSQTQEQYLLGTGLCISGVEMPMVGLESGYMYEDFDPISNPDIYISSKLGGSTTSRLLGFVIEESEIGEIKFEIWDASSCSEGMLVWCKLGEERVFFQITNGITREETFASGRHGYQIAIAAQLGVISEKEGFKKYPWVPSMNTPVFGETPSFGDGISTGEESDFQYGFIPGSRIRVSGSFLNAYDHHTAILGVTGSGKTELAFDIIRHAVKNKVKVICIDLTSKYENKLKDLRIKDMSIPKELARELSGKLFDVESGQYGAGKEKKVLEDFSVALREFVSSTIIKFLDPKTEEDKIDVGIIKLEEISNTKATLYITELYLTCLLNYARDNSKISQKILIVVEEAHTVMPEPSTMGLGDYDSRGLVGKIAQIALQGRKYGVGLLVIAQRTATVSKSVLTQCNTIISFTCFDDTSLGFLKNIFGKTHIALIPNLVRLQAVIFGKGVRSERPIVVEVPFDEKKVAGEA